MKKKKNNSNKKWDKSIFPHLNAADWQHDQRGKTPKEVTAEVSPVLFIGQDLICYECEESFPVRRGGRGQLKGTLSAVVLPVSSDGYGETQGSFVAHLLKIMIIIITNNNIYKAPFTKVTKGRSLSMNKHKTNKNLLSIYKQMSYYNTHLLIS